MGADPLASGLRAGPPLRAPDFAADSTDSSKFASGTLLDTALTLGASVNPGESPTSSTNVITWYLSDDPTVGVNTANTPLARELIQGQVAVPSDQHS